MCDPQKIFPPTSPSLLVLLSFLNFKKERRTKRLGPPLPPRSLSKHMCVPLLPAQTRPTQFAREKHTSTYLRARLLRRPPDRLLATSGSFARPVPTSRAPASNRRQPKDAGDNQRRRQQTKERGVSRQGSGCGSGARGSVPNRVDCIPAKNIKCNSKYINATRNILYARRGSSGATACTRGSFPDRSPYSTWNAVRDHK